MYMYCTYQPAFHSAFLSIVVPALNSHCIAFHLTSRAIERNASAVTARAVAGQLLYSASLPQVLYLSLDR